MRPSVHGPLPDGFAHWTLPRLIGVANAADLLFTGRTFDGDEAQAMGMANAVLPAGEVLPTALAVAEDLAASSAPLSVGLSKRLLWESQFMRPAAVARLENELQRHIAGQPDATEGVAAYLERRPPNWTGSISGSWPSWDPQTGAVTTPPELPAPPQ
jgi:enoyl-CoA hydratase/carnithine racemase